jgi:hypothetical protein
MVSLEITDQQVRGAHGSIKPGVKRSGTPGHGSIKNGKPAQAGDSRAIESRPCPIRWRPLRGLGSFFSSVPGAHAPGFMPTPASQAPKKEAAP